MAAAASSSEASDRVGTRKVSFQKYEIFQKPFPTTLEAAFQALSVAHQILNDRVQGLHKETDSECAEVNKNAFSYVSYKAMQGDLSTWSFEFLTIEALGLQTTLVTTSCMSKAMLTQRLGMIYLFIEQAQVSLIQMQDKTQFEIEQKIAALHLFMKHCNQAVVAAYQITTIHQQFQHNLTQSHEVFRGELLDVIQCNDGMQLPSRRRASSP